ncbi:MAG: hypothetical protein CM15mP70_08770 [Pelagibacteraceae bacterium]|nr:MAG: hypothetical protein CM15mP70_08770 [Pelagibacteraceae bacterium]
MNNIVVQSLGFEVVDRSDDGIYLEILEQNFNQSLSEMTLNAVEIVRSRVDFLGNKELSIQKVGLNKILLEIPGDLDNNVKDVISKTAKLTLHIEKTTLVNSKVFLNEETGEEVRVQEIPNLTGIIFKMPLFNTIKTNLLLLFLSIRKVQIFLLK